MGRDLAFRWRKSSSSGGDGQCLEIGVGQSRSLGDSREYTEVAYAAAVRDSKNSAGPTLPVDLGPFLTFIKSL